MVAAGFVALLLASAFGDLPCVTSGGTIITECFTAGSGWQAAPKNWLYADEGLTPIQLGPVACLFGGTFGAAQCTNDSAVWVAVPSPSSPFYGSALYGSGWVGFAGGQDNSTAQYASTSSFMLTQSTAPNLPFSWTPLLSLPYKLMRPVPINLNGYICLVGGFDNSAGQQAQLSTSQCLSSSTSPGSASWKPGPSLLATRQDSTPIEFAGWSCAVGGLDLNIVVLNTVECLYVPTASLTSTYTAFPTLALPNAVYRTANVTLQGLPCITGGSNSYGGAGLNSVLCLNGSSTQPPNTWSWLALPPLITARMGHTSFSLYPITAPPTIAPSSSPVTLSPTRSPTIAPTNSPTNSPTQSPTLSPTRSPTMSPTLSPTQSPTLSPTLSPTRSPTLSPTLSPTYSPTLSPTLSPTYSPTISPTQSPTLSPTRSPTVRPTLGPSTSPTASPTLSPTTSPTVSPTLSPTTSPTTSPTLTPSVSPTTSPTVAPTTMSPTLSPTYSPVWWTMDYSTSVVSSQWTTFSASSSPSSSLPTQLLWTFSNGLTATGSVVQMPPFSFSAGQSYSFTTETGSGQSVMRSSSQSFLVVNVPLVVSVSGGDHDAEAQSVITLDASASYDPDRQVPSSASPSSLLMFYWSSTCQFASLSAVSGPVVSLRTGLPEICTASVNVSSTSPNSTMTKLAQRTVSVRVVSQLVANVSIVGSGNIAVSDTLRLLASYSTTSSVPLTQFEWSVTPSFPAGFLDSRPDCKLPNGTSSARALNLPPLCLQEGVTYLFTFTVGTSLTTTQAGHNVFIVPRPYGGSCSVQPLTGRALETPFVIQCEGWLQSGVVLVSLSYSLNNNQTVISPSQAQSQFTVFLPQSSSTNLTVYISGYGDSFTTFNLPSLIVMPPLVCPLPTSSSQSLQNLTSAFIELLENVPSSTVPTLCGSAALNTSWVAFWNLLQAEVVSRPSPSTASLNYLASTFSVAIRASVLIATTSPSSSALTFPRLPFPQSTLENQIIALLTYFAPFCEGAPTPSTSILSVAPILFEIFSSVSDNGDCARSDKLVTLLTQIARSATAGNLPNDPALSLNLGGDYSVASSSYFSDAGQTAPILSSGSSVYVQLPSSLLSQGGSVSAVTVVTQEYQALTNPKCRSSQNSGSVLASSTVVDITLSTQSGELVGVPSTSGKGFSFIMPLADTQKCGGVTCSWWDPSVSRWNSTGCVGSLIPSAPNSYLCTCTHLTEFTLLLNPDTCPQYTGVFLAIFGLYLVTGTIAFIKVIVRLNVDRPKRIPDVSGLVWEHALMVLLCYARSAASFSLGSPSVSKNWALSARAAVLILPYLATFWIYTLLVFQWASIYHFGMKHKQFAFAKVRGLFLVSNIIVCGAIIALLVSLSSPSTTSTDPSQALTSTSSSSNDDRKRTLMIGATATLAAITLITAAGFLYYAIQLHKAMKTADGSRSATATKRSTTTSTIEQGKRSKCCDIDVKSKLLYSGIAVSMLLCVQAAMHVVSVAQSRVGLVGSRTHAVTGDLSELIVLVADWLGVVVLLAMFHKAMHPNTRGRTVLETKENKTEREKGGHLSRASMGSNVDVDMASDNGNRTQRKETKLKEQESAGVELAVAAK